MSDEGLYLLKIINKERKTNDEMRLKNIDKVVKLGAAKCPNPSVTRNESARKKETASPNNTTTQPHKAIVQTSDQFVFFHPTAIAEFAVADLGIALSSFGENKNQKKKREKVRRRNLKDDGSQHLRES